MSRINDDLNSARDYGLGAPPPDSNPTPLGPDLLPVPPFDPALLPERMRTWISDIADRMQAPVEFPAVAAIVAAGGCLGRRIAIKPQAQTDWLETPNIWGAMVARPSAMKSPTMAAGFAPLTKLEAEAGEAFEQAMQSWSVEAKLHEMREKAASELIKQAYKDQMRGKTGGKCPAIEDLIPPEKPIRKRHLLMDATYEKAGEVMAQNPDGIIVLRDELSGFLRPLSKPENAAARAFWLQSWTGHGNYTFDRIGRGTISIQCCASVFGAIQPSKLAAYLRDAVNGGDGDDGLLQRFGVIVYPDVSANWHDTDRWPDRSARTAYTDIFRRLAQLDPNAVGASLEEFDSIPSLRFCPEALRCFQDWRAALEAELRSPDLHPALESHFGKYRKLVPALALIFHLTDDEHGGAVSQAAVARAIAWAGFLSGHARRIYGCVTLAERIGARLIWNRLKAGKIGPVFSLRDIQQKGWTGLGDADAVRAALEVLLAHDLISVQSIPSQTTGGRPAERFIAHPKAASL